MGDLNKGSSKNTNSPSIFIDKAGVSKSKKPIGGAYKILITGAAGFLGGRVASYFAENLEVNQVIASSRRTLRVAELESKGCIFIAGDLTDLNFCNKLTENVSVVVHCAALSSPYGKYQAFYNSNYIATENVLNASIANGVKKFIFISTPSVYFNFLDRFNVKESEPLPTKMVNNYAKTKLMAEELVLRSNGNGIETISLRPRAIIGAEDTVLFPRVLEAYHKGKLKIIGRGNNMCDFTSARNVIEAVLCCIDAKPIAYGQTYNITDGEAVSFWKTLNYTLLALNLVPPKSKVPKRLAMFVAGVIELKAKVLRQKKEPSLTRYGVGILANNFTLDISKAKKILGYKPKVSTREAIDEFINWYKNNEGS